MKTLLPKEQTWGRSKTCAPQWTFFFSANW